MAPDFESLAQDHTLIFYDQRGGGESQLIEDPRTVGLGVSCTGFGGPSNPLRSRPVEPLRKILGISPRGALRK